MRQEHHMATQRNDVLLTATRLPKGERLPSSNNRGVPTVKSFLNALLKLKTTLKLRLFYLPRELQCVDSVIV